MRPGSPLRENSIDAVAMKHVLLAIAMTASALAAADDSTTGDSGAVLQRVEAYLDSITTLDSRFVQTNQDHTRLTGLFQLKRPHFLRFAYDDPPTLLIARGQKLIFRDGETGEVTEGSVDLSPAQFLLRPRIRFGADVLVTGLQRDSGYLAVTLESADEPGMGSLSLIFREDPMTLEQWLVRDAQGIITRITLVNALFGGEIDESLFEFDSDPFR